MRLFGRIGSVRAVAFIHFQKKLELKNAGDCNKAFLVFQKKIQFTVEKRLKKKTANGGFFLS